MKNNNHIDKNNNFVQVFPTNDPSQTNFNDVIFGKKFNGEIDVCRAPQKHRENNYCKHTHHYSFDEVDNAEILIKNAETRGINVHDSSNEKKVQKHCQKRNKQKTMLKNKSNKEYVDKEFLLNESMKLCHAHKSLSSCILDETFVEDFSQYVSEKINEFQNNKVKKEIYEQWLFQFVSSDHDLAVRFHRYVPEKVDKDFLLQLLLNPPKSMFNREKIDAQSLNNNDSSVARIVMSRLNNNMLMNVKNNFRSILFFKGVCCYCGESFNSRTVKPSGEHLTPVQPEISNDSMRGSTSYGNMVLACSDCNGNRGSQDLVEWISKTDRIRKEDKAHCLAKIMRFRSFTGYQEYSDEQLRKINETILLIDDFHKKVRETHYDKYVKNKKIEVRTFAYSLIDELNNGFGF